MHLHSEQGSLWDAVKKHKFSRQKSITESDFAWIFARNYEGTE